MTTRTLCPALPGRQPLTALSATQSATQSATLLAMLVAALSASLLPGVAGAQAPNATPAPPAANQPAAAIPAARPAPGAPANGRPAATPAAPAPTSPAAPPAAPQTATPAAAPATPPAAAAEPATPPAKKNDKNKAAEAPPAPPPKPGPLKPPSCAVAEFRAIGIDTTDEQTRRTKAAAWLKRKAKDCTAEQLIVMRNNRAQWLGSADSAELAAAIDGLLESFAETNREVSILLYGTPPPSPPPPDDKNKAAPKK